MAEQTILLAFTVMADSQREAEYVLHNALDMARLREAYPEIDSWWVAMRERYDGSDNDAAVFVPGSGMRSGPHPDSPEGRRARGRRI